MRDDLRRTDLDFQVYEPPVPDSKTIPDFSRSYVQRVPVPYPTSASWQGVVTLGPQGAGPWPQPGKPLVLAMLSPYLNGSKDRSFTLQVNVSELLGRAGQKGARQENFVSGLDSPQLTDLRRGDARADGVVNITDALFIAQYLVGVRELGDGLAKVHMINAASARYDANPSAQGVAQPLAAGALPAKPMSLSQMTGDQITIQDTLFIAQMLAGLRDDRYVFYGSMPYVQVPGANVPAGSTGNHLKVTVGNLEAYGDGLGAYDLEIRYNKDVIQI